MKKYYCLRSEGGAVMHDTDTGRWYSLSKDGKTDITDDAGLMRHVEANRYEVTKQQALEAIGYTEKPEPTIPHPKSVFYFDPSIGTFRDDEKKNMHMIVEVVGECGLIEQPVNEDEAKEIRLTAQRKEKQEALSHLRNK